MRTLRREDADYGSGAVEVVLSEDLTDGGDYDGVGVQNLFADVPG